MKKNQPLSLLFLLLGTAVFGQNDCSTLKSQNEKLTTELANKNLTITNQVENIQNLEKDIDYYKETLELLNSKISTKKDDFELKITSIIGQSDTGTIEIEGILENHGAIRKFSPYYIEITDPKGNSYRSFKIDVGPDKHLTKFQKNLPTKISIVIDKIGEEMPLISNFTAIFTGNMGKKYPYFILKKIPVTWE